MTPFSIIVPVFNEEEILHVNIARLLRHCDDLNTPYEIIIVSNGSTDTSDDIGRSLARQYHQVKCFTLPVKGVGRAFKKGILESRYDHLIFMDADLSAELSFIEKANRLLDRHVLVLGAKIRGLQHRSFVRKMGSLIFISPSGSLWG